jgi:hypothetical protein
LLRQGDETKFELHRLAHSTSSSFKNQENFCKVRGQVHFSANAYCNGLDGLAENMHLTPSRQDFAEVLLYQKCLPAYPGRTMHFAIAPTETFLGEWVSVFRGNLPIRGRLVG